MNKEDLYKTMGLIDDQIIEEANINEFKVKKRRSNKKWTVLVACLLLYSVTSSVLLAKEYISKQNVDPYLRYLTPESMELEPVTLYAPDKFIEALKSNNDEHIYIAINRLVESYNNEKERERALHEIEPFLQSESDKIRSAAAFSIDILSKTFESPYIVRMADGSIVFTLFHNYSDYGSHNVIWRIKDNLLEQWYSFSSPSMYVTDMVPSHDGKQLAIKTSSNKSDFVEIINIEQGMVSPELLESARVKFGAQHEINTWIRTDHENYSYVTSELKWKDNNTIQFEASLSYENTEIIKNTTVTYQFNEKKIQVDETVE